MLPGNFFFLISSPLFLDQRRTYHPVLIELLNGDPEVRIVLLQLSLVHFEVLGRVVMAVAVHEDVGPLVIFCVFEVVLIFARIDQSLD